MNATYTKNNAMNPPLRLRGGSTDLYLVQVERVSREQLSVRLRVFVLYYPTDAAERVPTDALFALELLADRNRWLKRNAAYERAIAAHPDDPMWACSGFSIDLSDAPLLQHVTPSCSEAWLAEHTKDFILRVLRAEYKDFTGANLDSFFYTGYEALGELAQAVLDVQVTDAQWIAHVEEGYCWSTTVYPRRIAADMPPRRETVLLS